MKGKKGFVQDLLFMGLVVFIFAIILIIGARIGNDANNQIQGSDLSAQAKDIMNHNTNKYTTITDYMFMTVFVIFMLSLFVGVFLLDTHPVLYWITVIILGISLIPLAIISNAFDEFVTDSSVSVQYADYSFINLIFSDWVLLFTVIGGIVLILLFSRTR